MEKVILKRHSVLLERFEHESKKVAGYLLAYADTKGTVSEKAMKLHVQNQLGSLYATLTEWENLMAFCEAHDLPFKCEEAVQECRRYTNRLKRSFKKLPQPTY
jgi:hypothetical protein